MSVGSADIHKAIYTLWNAQSLDDLFTVYWASGKTSNFIALNDGEGAPKNPFPYCVYDLDVNSVSARMSGVSVSTNRQEIHIYPLSFRIFAKKTSSLSQKVLASNLAEEIMKIFGGHPTVDPSALTLDNGDILLVQYESEFGVRIDDDIHQWNVNYMLHADVPVAA